VCVETGTLFQQVWQRMYKDVSSDQSDVTSLHNSGRITAQAKNSEDEDSNKNNDDHDHDDHRKVASRHVAFY
jgi:hypothetical protein